MTVFDYGADKYVVLVMVITVVLFNVVGMALHRR